MDGLPRRGGDAGAVSAAVSDSPQAAPRDGGTRRIEGYDLARALAIFGMVVVNFKVVMGAGGWTTDTPAGPAWLQSLTGLLDGRAAATFVVLAGVGVTLGARRAVASGDPSALSAARKTLWKRAAFLFFGGLLFATVWEADILHFYGWYIGIGALLIAFPNGRLLAVAALLTLAFPILLTAFAYDAEWNLDTLAYEGFWTPAGQARHLFFNGFHPVVPWLAFLLLGIWLGRRDVLDPATRRRLLIGGAAVALTTEAVSAALVALLTRGASPEDAEVIVALLGSEALPPMPIYMLAGGGTAVAVIMLAVAFAQRFPGAAATRAIVAAGQLSLTIYVAHVLIGMGALSAVGRLENQSLPFAIAASAAFYAVAVGFAVLWRKRFARGPLEWAMRKASG